MALQRLRHNFQTVAWFHDLLQRERLELSPPYQRRSVWNQEYKDYFIDTVLLGYPTAAVFLYEEFGVQGSVKYSVIDGKQRLTTLFEFITGEFPVSDSAEISEHRGKYWSQLDSELKKEIWAYEFLVEYIPTTEEQIINNIFDRINRNVAKLTRQELRHARFDGVFITHAEELAKWMTDTLPNGFPNIQGRSKRQMKDVELTATLLLLLDEGVKSYSQDNLDAAFSERDQEWSNSSDVINRFRDTITCVKRLLSENPDVQRSRLKNQADFYSLFGAISQLECQIRPDASDALLRFTEKVDAEGASTSDEDVTSYYESARSASNDIGPRKKRIEIISDLLKTS